LDLLSYCGEKDLLAHYFLNFHDVNKRHIIGSKDPKVNAVMIGEGEWQGFVETATYKNTKKVNSISYFWDDLLQRTCRNLIDADGQLRHPRGPSAIYEMAKAARFMRRWLTERICEAIDTFPDNEGGVQRKTTYLPTYYKGTGYVFLQLRVDSSTATSLIIGVSVRLYSKQLAALLSAEFPQLGTTQFPQLRTT
jgi:hypothetical protein